MIIKARQRRDNHHAICDNCQFIWENFGLIWHSCCNHQNQWPGSNRSTKIIFYINYGSHKTNGWMPRDAIKGWYNGPHKTQSDYPNFFYQTLLEADRLCL